MRFWKAKPQILLETSTHELLNSVQYIGVSARKRQEKRAAHENYQYKSAWH